MRRPSIDMIAKLFVLLTAGAMAGCGDMEPSGGREAQGSAGPTQNVVEPPAENDDEPAAEESADATGAPEWVAALDSPARRECHEQGALYDRRRSACSTRFRVASYTCDRQGIKAAFASTGFQIDQILDRSLGRPGFPDDLGEGFVIDQCGESDELLHVLLVAKSEDGRVLLREIEVVAPAKATANQP